MNTTLRSLAAGTLLALVVAACGSSATTPAPGSSGPAASLATSAAPPAAGDPTPIIVKDFRLDPKDVTVSGQASLGVTNAGPTIHNVSVRDASGRVLAATKDLRTGQSEVLTFDIPAGTYTLFCSLPGHESLGIKGTLTVTR